MPRPNDEFDDSFFEYVAEMAERAHGLERVLQWIKDNCGAVCEDFTECTHVACNSSCSAWLAADCALKGLYDVPNV